MDKVYHWSMYYGKPYCNNKDYLAEKELWLAAKQKDVTCEDCLKKLNPLKKCAENIIRDLSNLRLAGWYQLEPAVRDYQTGSYIRNLSDYQTGSYSTNYDNVTVTNF